MFFDFKHSLEKNDCIQYTQFTNHRNGSLWENGGTGIYFYFSKPVKIIFQTLNFKYR